VAVKLWLLFDADAFPGLAPVSGMAEQECLRALAEMEPEAGGWLRRELHLQGEGIARWERWEAAVEERRRGVVARLGRWGRGLFGR
jgi:hypothetical protein